MLARTENVKKSLKKTNAKHKSIIYIATKNFLFFSRLVAIIFEKNNYFEKWAKVINLSQKNQQNG